MKYTQNKFMEACKMYQTVLIVATVIAIIVVVFLASVFTAYLTKKKINVSGAITEAKAAIPIFEQVETMLALMLPQPYKAMANTFTTIIKKGVEVAEALRDAGQLTDDQRKAKALELINSALTLEKVTVTAKISNAISLAVDLAAILFVPHKTTTATATNTDTATTVAAVTTAQ
jgi:hypothetical protein